MGTTINISTMKFLSIAALAGAAAAVSLMAVDDDEKAALKDLAREFDFDVEKYMEAEGKSWDDVKREAKEASPEDFDKDGKCKRRPKKGGKGKKPEGKEEAEKDDKPDKPKKGKKEKKEKKLVMNAQRSQRARDLVMNAQRSQRARDPRARDPRERDPRARDPERKKAKALALNLALSLRALVDLLRTRME